MTARLRWVEPPVPRLRWVGQVYPKPAVIPPLSTIAAVIGTPGPAGPAGADGAQGPAGNSVIADPGDLTLIFENGLV